MYHKINIAKLSHAQIGKLLNGHRIRVKHGQGHEVHCSEEQHKKIHKAHLKGCGVNIQFDPYQIQHHQHMRGSGMFGSIAKTLAPVAKTAFKALAPVAIDALSGIAKKHINGMGHGEALFPAGSALYPAGYGVNPSGLGVKRKAGRPRGRGIYSDIAKGALKTLAPVAIDALSTYAKKRVGSGAKGARKGRRGKGISKKTTNKILEGVAEYAPLALSFL